MKIRISIEMTVTARVGVQVLDKVLVNVLARVTLKVMGADLASSSKGQNAPFLIIVRTASNLVSTCK